MRTGSRGLALIRQFEGLRLEAYRDSVGIWTIGYGHTAAAGSPQPRAGLRLTPAEAEALLIQDLGKYEASVNKALACRASQNQFDAMVSLCFNIGPRRFAGSRLVRAFNAGDGAGAALGFLAWTKAGGRGLAGLRRRREAEKRLFLSRTAPAKWAVAATGGTTVGTGLAFRFGEAALESLGYRLPELISWQLVVLAGIVAGAMALMALAAMGHDRREILWARLFGGWLA